MVKVSEEFGLRFEYGERGFGELCLLNHGVVIFKWWARSGSINEHGHLVNAISPHDWFLVSRPETPEEMEYWKMCIKEKMGFGWKWRLWPMPVFAGHEPMSHFLIHPDGGLPGTMGCIGIQDTNAMELYWFAKWFFAEKKDTIIKCEVKAV